MTRFSSTLALWALASLSFAQDLGTKRDPVSSAPASTGPIVRPTDLIQMLIALAVVGFLVKWAIPKVIGRLGRRIATPVGSTINLEESASFGGGQLQIVTVRGKTLLLCVATTGVTCLADLTDQGQAPVQEPVFFDILESADPTKAVVTTLPGEDDEDPAMSMDDAMALIAAAKSRIEAPTESPLDRLNRLTGKP